MFVTGDLQNFRRLWSDPAPEIILSNSLFRLDANKLKRSMIFCFPALEASKPWDIESPKRRNRKRLRWKVPLYFFQNVRLLSLESLRAVEVGGDLLMKEFKDETNVDISRRNRLRELATLSKPGGNSSSKSKIKYQLLFCSTEVWLLLQEYFRLFLLRSLMWVG